MAVLTERMKRGVLKHKYACVDTSPFSNFIMHPFWNYVVQFCPRNVAPNLLTLIGFLSTVLNFSLLTYYDPNFTGPEKIPRWLWLWSAILIFIAHTLDGIDGKQARRIGLSSPLGELLDHSCDAWTAFFLPASFFTLLSDQLALPDLFYYHWMIAGGFLIAHWEKSLTGVLYLPWSYDLSQIAVVVMFLLTYLFSPSIWSLRLPVVNLLLSDIIPYFAAVLFWVFSVSISVFNVVKACRKGSAPWPTLPAIVCPLLGNIFAYVLSRVWLVYSPTHVITRCPRLFLVCMGTLSAHITTRVILAELTKTRPPTWPSLMTLYALAVLAVCFGLPPSLAARFEMPCLVTLTTVIIVTHTFFCICMVNELCSLFKIRAFLV
uniref:Ethanolaminephosphotransferase 1 n=1 Tax=Schistocephalus solidus TaxID=70667 RepID=A0A0X3Q309_SCHSO